MLPDLLWRLLLIAGIESVAYQPGVGAARYLVFSLLVAWAFWMNRVRRSSQPGG